MRFEMSCLPKAQTERNALAELWAADGDALLRLSTIWLDWSACANCRPRRRSA